jgi:hypothetical protein
MRDKILKETQVENVPLNITNESKLANYIRTQKSHNQKGYIPNYEDALETCARKLQSSNSRRSARDF